MSARDVMDAEPMPEEALRFDDLHTYGMEDACPTNSADGSTSTTGSTSTSPHRRPLFGGGRPDFYALPDGTRVPGVTDILDSWAPCGSKDALMGWAAKLAREGKDWRKERDAAADFGTWFHAASERIDMGEDPETVRNEGSGYWGEAGEHAVDEYLRYLREHRPVFAIVELALVSKRYAYAGTFDRYHMSNRLDDYKTGKIPRATMIAQLGGYGELLRENGYGWPSGGAILCVPRAVAKVQGGPAIRMPYILKTFTSAEVLTGRDAFLRLLDLHHAGEAIERMLS